MKKIIAVVIAVLVMVTMLPAAMAKGNGNKPDNTAKAAKQATLAEQKAAKQSFQSALKIKKQTLQANHHDLMKLRIQVRQALEKINETLMGVLQSGTISPELSALLPQALTDMQSILDGLKATGNNGEIRRQVNACLKFAKQKDYTQALAEIDKLIAKQLEQKAALELLVTKVQTLLTSIVAAANTVPAPSPTPAATLLPTPSIAVTPTPAA